MRRDVAATCVCDSPLFHGARASTLTALALVTAAAVAVGQ